MRSLYERWREKVKIPADESGCWIWSGAVKGFGYGHLSRGRRGEGFIAAHRFAYTYFVGSVPDDMQVQHRCNNTRCVNPNHLKLGTPKENTRDMIEAGRDRFRENLPSVAEP